MNKYQKVNQLSNLLAQIVEIQPLKDPINTIQAVLEKMKDSVEFCNVASQIQKDLEDSNVKIQQQQIYGANTTPNFIDYIKIKYMGMPSVKDWSQIDQLTRKELCNSTEEQFDWVNVHDTQFDIDNQITFSDIQRYISSMPTDEYIDVVYGSDADLDIINYTDAYNQAMCKDDDFGSMSDFNLYMDLIARRNKSNNSINYDNPDTLVQSLTIQQRLERAIKMRTKAALILARRKIALSKRATPQKLEQRARKLAIRMLKQKYAGNKKIEDLSYAERTRIEKILQKKQQLVNALQRKMLPVVREIQKRRFQAQHENSKNK